MSITAINYAANLRRRVEWTPTQRQIFWHLCDQANSDTWSWEIVSHEDLAEKADTDVRTVRSALALFETERIITYTPNVGHLGQKAKGFVFVLHPQRLDELMARPADWAVHQREARKRAKQSAAKNPGNNGSENSSDPDKDLWITGSENSSELENSGSGNFSEPAGSEKKDTKSVKNFRSQRARTSSSHSETTHSSSSPPHSYRGTGGPLAPEEEDENPGRGQRPAAVAYGTAEPVYHHPKHGPVKLKQVQDALSGVSADPVTEQVTRRFAERILGRGGDEPKRSATGYVLAAIRASAQRTRYDLAEVTEESASPEGGQHQDVSGHQQSLCPIPAHASSGYRRSNCPCCRGVSGEWEFPEAITPGVFEALPEAHQRNAVRFGVRVTAEATVEQMRRTTAVPVADEAAA